ncbi:MAG: TetR/AcrR family transcriptional regulator [Magnetococcales bacterium]|nr:TetR/AcrR family transcriptional regulator [Magnetococcales bacterium]
MARRTDHTREELREMALEAARRAVRREGPAGLTARGLASAIGYSPGTLYNLFADLDDLIVHLNAATLETLEGRLKTALAQTASPEASAAAMVSAYVAFTLEEKALWGLLFEHRLPPGRELPTWYQQRIGALLGMLEEALRPFHPEEASRALAARALWCGVHGVCSLAAGGKLASVTDQGAAEVSEVLLKVFLAGLEKTAEGHH